MLDYKRLLIFVSVQGLPNKVIISSRRAIVPLPYFAIEAFTLSNGLAGAMCDLE